MVKVLEFKIILGELNFASKESYIFKFSSLETIDSLNRVFRDLFDITLSCGPLKNTTIEIDKIPEKLLQLIPNITNHSIKRLEKELKTLQRNDDLNSDTKILLIDKFIHTHGISTLQINLYYDAEN